MRSIAFAVLASLAFLSAHAPAQEAENPHGQWEKAIAEFEARDKAEPPAPGGVLFLGSSSIRMWDLKKWFPEVNAINRGFGGSQIADSTHFFDRIVPACKPATIVFYAGDNDIAKGKSAEVVAADFKALADRVWAGFPEAKILFIGIKPSIARWDMYPEMKKVNEAVRVMAQSEGRLTLIDVEPGMIGEDGQPRKELLEKDGLHMTEEGYALWTRLVTPHLQAAAAR